MHRFLNWTILLLIFSGCRAAPTHMLSQADTKVGLIQQVAHTEDLVPEELNAQLIGVVGTESAWSTNPDLEQYEQIVLASNPAIAEIDAEIESLSGKLTQAGLPPNPVVGINAEDINEDGGAGRYGVYFGRQVVRGNKLELSQSIVCAEIEAAKHRREMIKRKLLTDVRQAFFNLLMMQQRIETIQELVGISQQAVDTSEKLVEAQEIARTSLLQAELELQNANVFLKQAINRKLGAERQLAALIGEAELPFDSVTGNVHSLAKLEEFERSYDDLLAKSPELSVLFAEVEQERRNLNRQIAQPIPNVTWQSTLQFDTVTDDVVAGFQIGMPIPRRNQNQGAIYQSQYQIVAAERRADKKALDLRQQLAKAYQDYLDAEIQVDAFENEIIPKAEKTVELIAEAYREGELPFLEWLTAQRTYSQTQLTYLSQLQTLWNLHWEVEGMLLSGGLKD